MNDTTNQPADAEVELKTPDQLAEELKAAEIITVELINEVKAKPPALQSAEVEAAYTFKVINGYLETLKAAYGKVVINTSTTTGLEFAKEARYKLKTLRTRSEKLRLESNSPFAERITAHNDAQKMIEDAILPLEKRFDEAIKAHESAIAQRKKDEEAAAALKAANISAAINGINAMADDVMDLNSMQIAARIQEVTLHELNEEELGARFGEAVAIKDRIIAKLESARAKAEQNEANARQVEEDRKRHDEERKEREEREAAEREARNAIDDINTMLAAAGSKTPDQLENDIDGLEGIVFEQYRPLEAEARAAVERTLPVLRQTRDDKIAAALKAQAEREEAAKREKEDAARRRIADIKALVADSIGATSEAIKASIAKLDGMLRADFDPFAAEAEAEQERVRPMLEKLLAEAESAERTAAEKKADDERIAAQQKAIAERNQQIADRIAAIEGVAARQESKGSDSKTIAGLIEELERPNAFNEEAYGDRAIEAGDIAGDELVALRALFDKVKAAEDKAAKDEADAKALEENERAEKARKRQLADALADNTVDLFRTMHAVLADDGFNGLSNDTRLKVIGVLAKIDKAARPAA